MLDASVALTGPFRTAAAVPHHLVVGLEEVRSTFCSLLLVYARREAIHSIIAVLCVPARGCSILVVSTVAVSYGGDKSGEGIHRREQSPEQEVLVRRRAAGRSGEWVGIDAGGRRRVQCSPTCVSVLGLVLALFTENSMSSSADVAGEASRL